MSVFLLVVTIAGICYLTVANLRLAAFRRRPLILASEFLPNITVLKPIAGVEPDLYENLSSFCDQDYPPESFDIIFCLHTNDDPAAAIVERIIAEHPSCRATVAFGNNPAMLNPKIANLAKPGVELRGDIIVIADSDIHVDRTYLRAIAASFASDRVGAMTCLYSGIPNASVASRLGAMQIEDGFIPSVLVALAMGKLRFCMGATMAVRRTALEAIGGLSALGPHIADDHTLGRLVAEHGYDVGLSRYAVKTTIPETTWRNLLRHELRWARTNFVLAPIGYVFSFVMYALPLALLYLAISNNAVLGLGLLLVVLLLRVNLHTLARTALGVTHASHLWLIPIRDIMTLGIWLTTFFSRTIYWREQKYKA